MSTIRTTTRYPYYLAHIGLSHKLHTGGLLKTEMERLLSGASNSIAVTFVDHAPVCVALLSDYQQLMVFTHPKHRRKGLAKRTSKVLASRSGTKFKFMCGEVGVVPKVSLALFRSLGVDVEGRSSDI